MFLMSSRETVYPNTDVLNQYTSPSQRAIANQTLTPIMATQTPKKTQFYPHISKSLIIT